MMFSIQYTARWLVASSLIASLGLSGLFPQMIVWAESGSRVVAQQAMECCCGTEDGRCCGMGCCISRQGPTSEPCPCPFPKDSRNGQNGPMALALVKALFDDGGEESGSRLGRRETGLDRSLSESTLQTKHVRIDA